MSSYVHLSKEGSEGYMTDLSVVAMPADSGIEVLTAVPVCFGGSKQNWE